MWLVFVCVFVPVILLGFVRFRFSFSYLKSGLRLGLCFGFWRYSLYPKKEKKRKTKDKTGKKPKEKKEKPPKEPKEPFSLAPGDIQDIMRRLPKLFHRLVRTFRVDKLELCLYPGGAEASQTALRYGLCNAALAVLIPSLEHSLRIKRHRYEVRLDYGQEKPLCYAAVSISVSLGAVLRLGCTCIRHSIGFFIRHSRNARAKAEKEGEKNSASPRAA